MRFYCEMLNLGKRQILLYMPGEHPSIYKDDLLHLVVTDETISPRRVLREDYFKDTDETRIMLETHEPFHPFEKSEARFLTMEAK